MNRFMWAGMAAVIAGGAVYAGLVLGVGTQLAADRVPLDVPTEQASDVGEPGCAEQLDAAKEEAKYLREQRAGALELIQRIEKLEIAEGVALPPGP